VLPDGTVMEGPSIAEVAARIGTIENAGQPGRGPFRRNRMTVSRRFAVMPSSRSKGTAMVAL
jgi:hypothetical protein